MFVNYREALGRHLLKTKGWAGSVSLLLALLTCAALTAHAQNTFSSGSTGADGAFAPNTSQTITVPDSGVFNFTTVNIPSGVSITFARNTTNKPLTILASGDVVITGTINIDGKAGNGNGSGGSGGPGGFNGGAGGYGFDQSFTGIPGDGPGGGGGGIGGASINPPGYGGGGGYSTAGGSGFGGAGGTNSGQGGARYGAVTVLPLIGGSGGGGGAAAANNRGGAGGGGGGAILIASSTTITINGAILARGGGGDNTCSGGPGAGGSGGAVRLVANTVKGSGSIPVNGGPGTGCFSGQSSGTGGQGFVRVEAFDYSALTASTTPSNIISFALPHPVTVSNAPSLRIASVGGIGAPASPTGSLQGVPDIIVPSTTTNPMTVALEGANLPVGTVVQVTLTPSRGNRTSVQSTGLAGTEAASTASASLSLPTGVSVISASAVIDLTSKADPLFMDGERVNRIEVAAVFGSGSEVTYVTQSGRRIKRASN